MQVGHYINKLKLFHLFNQLTILYMSPHPTPTSPSPNPHPPVPPFLLSPAIMKYTYKTLVIALFAWISLHMLCSSLSLYQANGIAVEREDYARRLLASVDVYKYRGGALKEPKKAVDPSLRKAPRSGPNPTQNK